MSQKRTPSSGRRKRPRIPGAFRPLPKQIPRSRVKTGSPVKHLAQIQGGHFYMIRIPSSPIEVLARARGGSIKGLYSCFVSGTVFTPLSGSMQKQFSHSFDIYKSRGYSVYHVNLLNE